MAERRERAAPPRGAATAWEERVIIPTYPVGAPDRNPMFLEKRVYQGSSGAVYPFSVIDRISDEKEDRSYRAVFLENEYLRIMVLPELGGRIQMAYAKKLDYHFIYYNRVIKPALVGLTGPWISGGIEFNWPQHHRPSTFLPVDWLVENGTDGRATVWLGETDRMHGTRSVAALSLYPGRAYLEVDVRLWNPTPFPQTFLWWANPAVHANENYQSVFPPDVRAVFDHGRRDVSTFPIATGTYYKVDYSAGVDISWYKNIPVPTSYMAYRSEYDFVGGYDHGRRAGLLHVADHHVSPGKKQWTWGCGDFGAAWERNLTDEDGPYIELMTGVFTDNQPDFSWLEPGEHKHFTQYFFPYAGIGMVKKATRDLALAFDVIAGEARVGVSTTAPRLCGIHVTVNGADQEMFKEKVGVAPEKPFMSSVRLPEGTRAEAVTVSVLADDGAALSYRPGEVGPEPVPEPARAPLAPADVPTSEELFLIGLHLEQYRHATFRPEDYYLEALRRDPGDIRCNQAMGILSLRRGDPAAAEACLRRAVQRVTSRNPNPSDGSAYLFLGLALEMQGRDADAEEAWFKAAWNGNTRAAAYAGLARCAMRRGDFPAASERGGESLSADARNPAVRIMKAVAFRRQGRRNEAEAELRTALREDPLNPIALNELTLLGLAGTDAVGDDIRARLEAASLYVACGLFDDAAAVLAGGARTPDGPEDPLTCYMLAFCKEKLGDPEAALRLIRRADSLPPGAMFVNQLDAIPVLELAARLYPEGARASYHLGNLFYNNRLVARAVEAWQQAEAADGTFPTVHRNLALAAFNNLGDPARALAELEKAFALDPSDSRVLLELDQLRKRLGVQPAERLRLLSAHLGAVQRRDDLTVEWASLLNLQGEYAQALTILRGRKFHPWEGGEGKVSRQYVTALLGLSKQSMQEGKATGAAELARLALSYPASLGEGKLAGAAESDVHYVMGCALEAAGDAAAAGAAFEKASTGENDPSLSLFYNDQPADMIFFQGCALLKLGKEERARERFARLFEHGERHLHDRVAIDYFAVSLPDMLIFDDDLSRRNRIFCRYLSGLGLLGSGSAERARAVLEEVIAEDPAYAGAVEVLRDLDRGWRP
ncbi:MAG TPA: DUF5107 domain-containing protein [Spirochaetia bacterium]|nr:DUF5107 domain-containing protein [Spirochaetia bacterium]